MHVSELTCHLGYWIRQVSNHVSHNFARKLATRGITVAEWAVMRMLYDKKPISSSQVAISMGLTKGAITKLADRLISKKMVIRKTDNEDGRVQTLSLTRQAEILVPELAALADQNDHECFAHLSKKDQEFFQRILEDTVKQLGITTVPIE